jgi:predicted acetyltransferase
MNNIILEQKEKREIDEDYDIIVNNQKVGIILITRNENYIFIRQISINDEFKRKGIAKDTINYLVEYENMPVKFCVATNSQSAIAFWKHYLETTKYKNERIRGELYIISKND